MHISPITMVGFHSVFCRECGLSWKWLCMRFLSGIVSPIPPFLGTVSVSCIASWQSMHLCEWMLQWKVLWGRTSCYTEKLMTVLLYIMDSIFRWTFVPLAWLHYARGLHFQCYVVKIEVLESRGDVTLDTLWLLHQLESWHSL